MNIGSLALSLVVDATQWESGIQRAVGRADQIGKAVVRMSDQAVAAFEAIEANPIGAALAAAAFIVEKFTAAASFASTTLHEMNDAGVKAGTVQADLSRKFGLSADGAAGLSLAARKVGVDADSLSHSLMIVQRDIGKAAAGSEEAARGFTRLGLDAGTLSKLPVEQQLGQIGDALNKIPVGAERSAAMFAVLGRHGQALWPILAKGTAGLTESTEQAKRWGLEFSAADAAVVKSAGLAQTQAEIAANSVYQSFANRLAVAFAPVKQGVSELVTGFIDFAEPVIGFVRDMITGAGSLIKDVIDGIKDGFADWAEPLQEVKAALVEAWGQLSKTLGITGDWHNTMKAIGRYVGGGLASAFLTVAKIAVWVAEKVNAVANFLGIHGSGGLEDLASHLGGPAEVGDDEAHGGTAGASKGPTALAAGSREALELFQRSAAGGEDVPRQQLEEMRGLRDEMKGVREAVERGTSAGKPAKAVNL